MSELKRHQGGPSGVEALFRDRLVMVVNGPEGMDGRWLREKGARDALVLDRNGPKEEVRGEFEVRGRYRKLGQVRQSNAQVAVLHGAAAWALAEKRKVGRFERVLVAAGGWSGALAGWLHYGLSGKLAWEGTVVLEGPWGKKRYLVLAPKMKLRDQRRQYGPSGATPLEILRELDGLRYVALRWSEMIEAGTHEGDIDFLIARADLPAMRERLNRRIGTYPLDVYTDDGQEGFAYKSVPYFTPVLAKRLLDTAVTSAGGLRIGEPLWRYLAFCYHLTFHNKSEKIAPGTERIEPGIYPKPHYHEELVRLAGLAGREAPRSYTEIERELKAAGVMPSLDLIGFYSNRNEFLKKRYFDQAPPKPGLATFFVRDFGEGSKLVEPVRNRLAKEFRILKEGAVDEANRERIVLGVRGGNWADHDAPGGAAEPVHWFVCWDENPESPSARTRRKHPRVDNEKVRVKDELRRDLAAEGVKSQRVIHSSDNTLEALDHLEHLGLIEDPEVAPWVGRVQPD